MSDSKNGYIMKGQFTPENSALVLVDYQVGTMQLIRTSSSDVCLRNAVTLATAAKTLKMPIVLTSSQEDRVQGPISPALQKVLPDAFKARVKRQGIVNAWGDPNFSAAIVATGRKNFIMGGVVLTTTNTMVAELVQNWATPAGMELIQLLLGSAPMMRAAS